MKAISTYINEKLKFSKDFKMPEKYAPKNKEELKKAIGKLLDEYGADANLNVIDVSSITDMSGLFQDNTDNKKVGNIDISEWDVSNVTNMRFMFMNCKKFNCDLSKWNVSKCEDMDGMFQNCEEFNSDISGWDVSNVTMMGFTFSGCKKFNQDLSGWNVSKCEDMESVFAGCTSLSKEYARKCDRKWDTSNVLDPELIFTEENL